MSDERTEDRAAQAWGDFNRICDHVNMTMSEYFLEGWRGGENAAARTPGPDVSRLLDVSARMLDAYDVYAIDGLFEEFRAAARAAIAEHEAARSGRPA